MKYLHLIRPEFIAAMSKFVLFCMFLYLSGCTILTPTSDKLKHSNADFVSDHKRAFRYDMNTFVEASYLGKFDNKYIYMAQDSEKQKAYFILPANNNEKAVVTMNSPGQKEKTGKTAKIHFYGNPSSGCFQIVDRCESQISSATDADKTADFPSNIFVKSDIRYYIRHGVEGHEIDFYEVTYASKDGVFSNRVDKITGLSLFDSVVLGARSSGYILTAPIDMFATVLFSPLLWVLGPCGGSPFGCP